MKIAKVLMVIAITTCVVVGMAFGGAGGGRAAGGAGGGFGGGGRGGRGPARQVAAMADALTLTEDQVTKLNAIPVTDPNIALGVTTANTALTAAVIAGDDAKIKEAVKGVAAATEKNAMAQSAEYKKVKAILTEAQYKQMTTTMTTPRGGRGGAGGGRGGN